MTRAPLAAGLALAASLAAPGTAQGQIGQLYCVGNSGGYVARATFEERRGPRDAWLPVRTQQLLSNDRHCERLSREATDVRLTVEGFTGFEWRRICRHEFPTRNHHYLTLRGTVLIWRCEVGP